MQHSLLLPIMKYLARAIFPNWKYRSFLTYGWSHEWMPSAPRASIISAVLRFCQHPISNAFLILACSVGSPQPVNNNLLFIRPIWDFFSRFICKLKKHEKWKLTLLLHSDFNFLSWLNEAPLFCFVSIIRGWCHSCFCFTRAVYCILPV